MQAVIFDMDGLLIDSEVISLAIYQNLLSRFGCSFTKETYAAHYSGRTEEANVKRLLATYHLNWSFEQALENVYAEEAKLISQGIALKSGAKELLEDLKSHQVAIGLATSSVKERALTILNQHHLLPYFDQMVFGHEVEHGKPAPDIFIRACEKLGFEPKECLVLEDSESGVQAAYAAGIPVICVPDMKLPSSETLDKALATVDSLHEVRVFLNN
ncbi:HAD family hydrolase [Streptococcus merionis]|uniref:HAD family hydrolase n=1 Tax=Streptococcus merionis TaxID=400065 RepID=UPI00351838C9